MTSILLGPLVTVAASLALGYLLLAGLRLRFARQEQVFFAFTAGAACLALLVLPIGALHVARRGVFLWTAVALVALALWRGRTRGLKPLPSVSRGWLTLLVAVVVVFTAVYVLQAALPDARLGSRLVRYWQHRGFTALPHAAEPIYLCAFTFGRHPSVALTHLAFLAALAWGVLCYGRRFGFPAAGAFAAILVYASPFAAAGNAMLPACLLFAAFYLLEIWNETRERRFLLALIPVGLFAVWLLELVRWPPPLQLAVFGTPAAAPWGPVFLLAPLALLALRHRRARRLLAAAAVTALTPALLPIVALAMGLGMMNSGAVLPAVAVGHAVMAWPGVVGIYSHRAATWSGSSDEAYELARLIERVVPEDRRVLALAAFPSAYTSVEVSTDPELREVLLTPLRRDLQARAHYRFRIPGQALHTLRIDGFDSATEVRLFRQGAEIPRSAGWRLRPAAAAGFAFDNSYVTRATGLPYLEVEFPAPLELDAVLVECPAGQRRTPRLPRLPAPLERSDAPEPHHLRRAAVDELKARGIGYLLVRQDDPAYPDLRRNELIWGLTSVGANDHARLYRLD